MTSSHQNSDTKENGTMIETPKLLVSMWKPFAYYPDDDTWELLEDKLNKKKKIRIVSKYSEKRYIP